MTTGKLEVSVHIIPLSSNHNPCLFHIIVMEAAKESPLGCGM